VNTGFTAAQVQAILMRDGYTCAMRCGRRATIGNHRGGRGMGGSRHANRIANGCAICWSCNSRIEEDAIAARKARELGVKISRHDDPEQVPYRSPMFDQWVHLHDDDMTFDVTDDELDAHLRTIAAMV
jgi:hypothetical protein